MTLHPDIERLALLGWHLVPATASKKGMFAGKRYGLRSFIDAATADLDQLESWAREFPGCCWKARPEGSGVWFLDVDVPGPDHDADGVHALRAFCDLHGPLPPRPHGRTPSGGHLLVFRDTGTPIRRGSAVPAPGMDTLHGKLCPMVSPSRRNGGAYRWIVAPWELAPPPAPAWLLRLLEPPPAPPRPPKAMTPRSALDVLDRVLRELARAGQGSRNAALNRAAFIGGKLAGAGMVEEADAVTALYSAGRHIGLDDAECRKTIRSGWQAGLRSPVHAH